MIEEYTWEWTPTCCPDCDGVNLATFKPGDWYAYYRFLHRYLNDPGELGWENRDYYYIKYFVDFKRQMTEVWRQHGYLNKTETIDDIPAAPVIVTLRITLSCPWSIANPQNLDPAQEAQALVETLYAALPEGYKQFDDLPPFIGYTGGSDSHLGITYDNNDRWSATESVCPICGSHMLYSTGYHAWTVRCPICNYGDADTTW
jgi:hypothetical protein